MCFRRDPGLGNVHVGGRAHLAQPMDIDRLIETFESAVRIANQVA
jgi:hypothetical protein